MTEIREIRTFLAMWIVAAELRADSAAAAELPAMFARQLREKLAAEHPDDIAVSEPEVEWCEISEAEELMSYYEGEPTVRAGDWRAIVRMRVAVAPDDRG